MGYIYKSGAKNRLLSERPRSFRDSKGTSDIKNKYFREDLEIARVSEEKDKQLKDFDQRYAIIVNLFMTEIEKRKIDIRSDAFQDKMDEVLEIIFQSQFFRKRFPNDNLKDIRNTVLRKVNSDRQNKGKGREDE